MTLKELMKKLKKYRRTVGPAADDTEVVISIAGHENELHAFDDSPVCPNPLYNLTVIKVV